MNEQELVRRTKEITERMRYSMRSNGNKYADYMKNYVK